MNRKGIFFACWSFIGFFLALLLQVATFLPLPMDFGRMFFVIWLLGASMFVPLFPVHSFVKQYFWYAPLATLRSIPIWAGAIGVAAMIYGVYTQQTVSTLYFRTGWPAVQNGQFIRTIHSNPFSGQPRNNRTEVIAEQEYYELNRALIRGWSGMIFTIYTLLALYFLVRILRSRSGGANAGTVSGSPT